MSVAGVEEKNTAISIKICLVVSDYRALGISGLLTITRLRQGLKLTNVISASIVSQFQYMAFFLYKLTKRIDEPIMHLYRTHGNR